MAAVFALSAPLHGSLAAFLKIDGIDGEAADEAHRDEIEVLGWSWGLQNSGTTHTATGGGAGKASVSDLKITKKTDRSSPRLALRTASGMHVPSAQLTAYRPDRNGEPVAYLVFQMEDVIITSYSMEGSVSEDARETVSLNFARFEYTYTPPSGSDGSSGTPVSIGWDIAKNEEM